MSAIVVGIVMVVMRTMIMTRIGTHAGAMGRLLEDDRSLFVADDEVLDRGGDEFNSKFNGNWNGRRHGIRRGRDLS